MLLICGHTTIPRNGLVDCMPENSAIVWISGNNETRATGLLRRSKRRALGGYPSQVVWWGVSPTYIQERFDCERPRYLARLFGSVPLFPVYMVNDYAHRYAAKSDFWNYVHPQYDLRITHVPTPGALVAVHRNNHSHSGEGLWIGRYEDRPRTYATITRYIADRDEYRVHFARNGTNVSTLIGKKRRKLGSVYTEAQVQIRNLENGWVYSYWGQQVEGNRAIRILAAVRHVVDQFDGDICGAIDVVWDREARRAYAIEYNSAPGINHSAVRNFYRTYFASFEGES